MHPTCHRSWSATSLDLQQCIYEIFNVPTTIQAEKKYFRGENIWWHYFLSYNLSPEHHEDPHRNNSHVPAVPHREGTYEIARPRRASAKFGELLGSCYILVPRTTTPDKTMRHQTYQPPSWRLVHSHKPHPAYLESTEIFSSPLPSSSPIKFQGFEPEIRWNMRVIPTISLQ